MKSVKWMLSSNRWTGRFIFHPIISKKFATLSHGNSSQEWFSKGIDFWNKNRIVEAIDSFEKSISVEPTSDAFYNLGNCFAFLKKNKEAIDAWNQSLLLDDQRVDVHVNLANLYALHTGDFDAAIKHYQKALELNPQDGQVHFNLAVLLDRQSNLQDAIQHYQKARQLGIDASEKYLRNAMIKFTAQAAKSSEEN